MQKPKDWIFLATEDLKAAKELINLKLFSAALFHCQQAAEKILKAYLLIQKQPIQKTHDLVRLLEKCTAMDKSFSKLLNNAEWLNPLATKFRYPDDYEPPNSEYCIKSMKNSDEIFNFVNGKIIEIETGQTNIFK